MNGQTPPVPPQQHPADTQSVQLSRASAARTEQVVRWVERNYRLPPPRGGAGPRMTAIFGETGTASGTITARSGTTPGGGTVVLDNIDQSTGAISAGSDSVAVKNRLNKTVASGSGVVLLWARGFFWVVAVDDCAHLS